jgi:hypothetical protein
MPIRIVLLTRKRIDYYTLMGFNFSFSYFKLIFMDICHEKIVINKKKTKLKPMQRRNIIPIQHSGCGKKAKHKKKN